LHGEVTTPPSDHCGGLGIQELKFSPCHPDIRMLTRRTKHEVIIKLYNCTGVD
jgi:hypothetical protein